MWEDGLHGPERAFGTRVEQKVHVARAHLAEGCDRPKRLGVGHEAVHSAESGDGCLHQGESALPIPHVEGQRDRLGSDGGQLLARLLQAFGLAARYGQTHPQPGEVQGDAAADPACRSRHDDDSALEIRVSDHAAH